MQRPMMQFGVGRLEELFAQSKKDQLVLEQLEHELAQRQVPRALTLLGQVRSAMKVLTRSKSVDAAGASGAAGATGMPHAPAQPEPKRPPLTLEGGQWAPDTRAPQTQAELPVMPPRQPAMPALATASTGAAAPMSVHAPLLQPIGPPVAAPTSFSAPNSAPLPLPQMSLEDACRILRVLPTDPWEQIELSRQKLVMRSHPDKLSGSAPAQVQQAQAEVRRVNDAYSVLAGRRAGRQ